MPTSPVRIHRHSAAYWQVTFDNPPLNLIDPEVMAGLRDLLTRLESDRDVKVVVFGSADDEFFLAHYDAVRAAEMPTDTGPTGLPPWPDVVVRLARAPFVSIACLRGRARGAGSEFALACDLRFASIEKAVLGQPEVGSGVVPGGGAMEILPALVGRSRALEIVLGSEDFDAATAERYGWVNRALPDAELDAFVDGFASRIARFDQNALSTAKDIINRRSALRLEDIVESGQALRTAAVSPNGRARLAELLARGMQQRGPFEFDFGAELGRDDSASGDPAQ
ncbi:enoyl-CoA hydratase/isomerase family protein [Streptomyces marianii]|uniref:enoyl-CoA hydratase/isomerase family protein n=1 Tax=Streptomyces marianii TaxID=1817406 RepID=UPI0018F8C971|nr:enoyl-CoA hydratase/isomerase family protein [Streptomyces marianii]